MILSRVIAPSARFGNRLSSSRGVGVAVAAPLHRIYFSTNNWRLRWASAVENIFTPGGVGDSPGVTQTVGTVKAAVKDKLTSDHKVKNSKAAHNSDRPPLSSSSSSSSSPPSASSPRRVNFRYLSLIGRTPSTQWYSLPNEFDSERKPLVVTVTSDPKELEKWIDDNVYEGKNYDKGGKHAEAIGIDAEWNANTTRDKR